MSAPAFTPAWWLPSPHLQTLWGSLCRTAPKLQRRRERLWLDDGDFLDLDLQIAKRRRFGLFGARKASVRTLKASRHT